MAAATTTLSSEQYFRDIPELDVNVLKPFTMVTTTGPDDAAPVKDVMFGPRLQKFANQLIYRTFPIVSSLTLKYVDDELGVALEMKQRTLRKLKKKYERLNANNINIVQDIYIDDYEMAVADNVKLVPDDQARLLRTTNESNLIQIIIKNFEANVQGRPIDTEFKKIYSLLNEFCDNRFTRVEFTNTNQQTLDEHLLERIVRVWQIFEQYFKQFDYVDYLQNYYTIKSRADIKFTLSILRILMDVGALTC